jgi:hypothetical protein
MTTLPIIGSFNENTLAEILSAFPGIKRIAEENRQNFVGKFPLHTRYFKNGDIPLVALINIAGKAAVFGMNDASITLRSGDFIFFDDSQPHSWIFEHCTLDIFYYRLPYRNGPKITQGDYCLDNYF